MKFFRKILIAILLVTVFSVSISVSVQAHQMTDAQRQALILQIQQQIMQLQQQLAQVIASNSAGALADGAAANYRNFTAFYNNIAIPADGLSADNLYIFKSIPTFTFIPSVNASTANGSNINLYTFSISADPSGPVSVKQLTFIIAFSDPNNKNPNLTNFSFVKNGADYAGPVSIGNIVNNNYIGLTSINGVGVGFTNTVVLTFGQEEKIPAGQTQTYTLKAVVNNLAASSDSGVASISIYMPSDTNTLSGGRNLKVILSNIYYGLLLNPQDLFATVYNVLWSDISEALPNFHNDLNGNYTNDWYNGFGVLNLPLATQTISPK